jgi:carbon storage regulator
MLVLTRKLGEEVVIGDSIRVRVLAVHGSKVRLGITAPRDVWVMREECLTAAGPNGEAASGQAPPG